MTKVTITTHRIDILLISTILEDVNFINV